VLQWHPDMQIGFGYAMNLLELTPANERARELQLEVLRCAKRVQGSEAAGGRAVGSALSRL
jgi:hypothetical protein